MGAASRGPSCSELADVPPTFDLPHGTEDLSVEELIPRSSVKLSAMTAGKHVRGCLHMTDIIGSVHLNQESIGIIELERFL